MIKDDMQYLTIALPKGKLFYLAKDLFAKVGFVADNLEEKSRKLVITNEELKLKFIIAKTADVPTYVEHGAADIGVIGKDVLMEAQKDVYELLDLGFGRCHLMMAVPKDKKRAKLTDYTHTRVATKFPNVAKQFFTSKGMQMEYIKMNGSIELAPIVGLSEVIVDIVETGTTLNENGLVVLEEVCPLSARMIVNPVSMRMENDRIKKIVTDLRELLREEQCGHAN